MFRIPAIVVLCCIALAVPFAHVPGASVCAGQGATEQVKHSCCGATCSSGCCAADHASGAKACCAATAAHRHDGKAPHVGSSHCGTNCSGCVCCTTVSIPVVALAVRGLQIEVPLLERLDLVSDSFCGLTHPPCVPPPIAA